MKPILKAKHKLSMPVILAMFTIVIVGCISFIFSLKYSGINKSNVIILKTDASLLSPESVEKGGFHTSDLYVSLDSPEGNKIYYTLDGTQPDLSSALYSGKILITDRSSEQSVLSVIPTSPRWKPPLDNVSKGTVLRAVCVTENNLKSKEFIKTYFIKKNRYTLPVISLTINKDDFFGYKSGIYVMGKNYEDKRDYLKKHIPLNVSWWDYPSNYKKRGSNSERICNIEFYEENGELAFENMVGVRINGNATRGFSQKSLRIIFDKKYGDEQLSYSLFPDIEVKKFNAFILRNSGNDWNKTMFRDAFMQSLFKSYLDVQAYRPSVVFINGEYWGIHEIRERSDEHYISNKYSISLDSIAILEFEGNVFFGKKKDSEEFKELLNFISTKDLSVTQNYQYVEGKIDINSFMDFIIANVYFCNSDWPNNNVKYWRYKGNQNRKDSLSIRDGKWRWMLYDTDWGFGYTGSNAVDLDLLEKAKKTGTIGIIFSGLLENKSFVAKFQQRFDFHLKNTFETNSVIKKIDMFQKLLAPEMNEHISRWREINSYENWESNVEELKRFAMARPVIQRNQLDIFLNKH